MKSNYKRLEEYIEPCDLLNEKMEVTLLQGVSNEKYFQSCKSNTVDIDLSRYRICRKGWFAYNRATTRNGDRLSIAYREGEDCLVSPSYKCFKIRDESKLLPHYLLLWFKRPEFDRYARFMSHGSAHEYFEYEQMCEVMLPIPNIEEQKSIVKAYQTIEKRIELKRKINDNLDATAFNIYRKMFDYCNDALPQGWSVSPLETIADVNAGGDRPLVCEELPTIDCNVPIYSNGIENEGLYGYTNEAKIFRESVTISARGTVGYVFLREQPYFPIVRLISVVPKCRTITAKYLYFVFRTLEMQSTGTSQQQITVPDFKKQPIVVPSQDAMDIFSTKIQPIFSNINKNKMEINSLTLLLSNLLTLLSR